MFAHLAARRAGSGARQRKKHADAPPRRWNHLRDVSHGPGSGLENTSCRCFTQIRRSQRPTVTFAARRCLLSDGLPDNNNAILSNISLGKKKSLLPPLWDTRVTQVRGGSHFEISSLLTFMEYKRLPCGQNTSRALVGKNMQQQQQTLVFVARVRLINRRFNS